MPRLTDAAFWPLTRMRGDCDQDRVVKDPERAEGLDCEVVRPFPDRGDTDDRAMGSLVAAVQMEWQIAPMKLDRITSLCIELFPASLSP